MEEKTKRKMISPDVLRRLKKHLKWLIPVLLAVCIGVGFLFRLPAGQQAAASATYQTAATETRDITKSLTGSGTLEPADSYTVNTLVSGEVLSDTFEEGDQVEEGQLSIRWIPPMLPAARPRPKILTPRRSPTTSRQ